MYGKEFSSPQQTISSKLDQGSATKNMKVSGSQKNIKNQQPTNLPSKYTNQRINHSYGSFKSPEQPKNYQKQLPQNGNTQSRFLQNERDQHIHKNENNYYKKQLDTQSHYNHNHDEVQSRASITNDTRKSQANIHMLNTQKFLKSDINEYLKQEEGRCISCSECMKTQDKNLFYKYPQHLKSNYIDEYSKFDPNAKSKEFNLDKEKLRLKVPYKVARDFTSTHQAEFKPFQVMPKENKKDEDDMFELNHPCFIGSTTYNKTFQNWGAGPRMKPTQQSAHIIDMKIQDKTTYKETFSGDKDQMPQFMKEHEKLMKKQCVQKMQQGSLNRLVDAPFMGQSVSHETFKKPKEINKKELCKPMDEVTILFILKFDLVIHSKSSNEDWHNKLN
ncbi:UNKNOWN [Stylonychia lemnae]|uniref:STOP protein n=1 Tax=Stylonychia lemnae TaxID=5949 RepID=A0A077ZZD6_STYLE|nr:UNKNOWN [Stylonychia lemnae]|eukprot:CDW75311.1 UNKNOWN [Stylonychia lemnae]